MKRKKIQKGIVAFVITLIIVLVLFSLLKIIGKNTFFKGFATGEREASFNSPEAEPVEIVIKFKNPPTIESENSAKRIAGASSITTTDISKVKVLTNLKRPQDIDSYVVALKRSPYIEYAEPNYVYQYMLVPNDQYFPQQWDLNMINAPSAWDISKGNNALIAILDSGVDITHPDLSGKIVKAMNTQNDEPKHGTHVAGIAAALTNNAAGIAGISYDTKLIVADVGDSGGVKVSEAASAIRWAVDNGAFVINMSWGGIKDSMTLHDQITYAASKGALLVSAAGNLNNDSKIYPASYPEVISVAATSEQDRKASFSSYGSWVTISAPGTNILSTIPSGNYASYNGTSMSSPLVSGLLALMKSKYPNYSATQIRSLLCDSADKIFGTGTYWQCGRINAYKALGGVLIGTSTPLAVTPTPVPPTTAPTIPPTIPPTPTATAAPSCSVSASPSVITSIGTNQIITAIVTNNNRTVTNVTFSSSNTALLSLKPSSVTSSPYVTNLIWNKTTIEPAVITIKAYLSGSSSPVCQTTVTVGRSRFIN